MADLKSHRQKFHIKVTLDAGTGVKGETNGYQVYGETNIRVTPTGVGGSNVVDVEGRLEGETTWTSTGTITGTTSDTIDISTYDYIRFNQTTSDSTGEVIVSGFFNQIGSLAGTAALVAFKTIQADAGTSPVADSPTDTLTITSSDASVTVTGNATTDTIDLTGAGVSTFTALSDTPATFTGESLKALRVNVGETAVETYTPSVASGDVVGPASSTDNAVARFDSTTGLLLQDTANLLVRDDGTPEQPNLGLSTFFGYLAGNVDDGTNNANTFIGYGCGELTTTGQGSTALGYKALAGQTNASSSIGIGYFSGGSGSSSAQNVSIGYFSLFYNQTGDRNTVVGHQSGFGAPSQSYSQNVFYGYQSGFACTTGGNNTFLGYKCGNNTTTGTDNICIGYQENPTAAGTSNFLNIGGLIYGDTSTLNVGINVATSWAATLDINQSDASGAEPVLKLNQADIDDTFINFSGTSAADGSRSISSDTTEDSAKFGAIRVEINGTTKWIRIYDDES